MQDELKTTIECPTCLGGSVTDAARYLGPMIPYSRSIGTVMNDLGGFLVCRRCGGKGRIPAPVSCKPAPSPPEAVTNYMDRLSDIAQKDVEVLRLKDAEYGSSWKKRGGAGSYFMVARKFDRLENAVKSVGYDIFEAIRRDAREEGVLDDVRDLRRYLLLIEAEVLERAKPSGQDHPFGYDAEDENGD